MHTRFIAVAVIAAATLAACGGGTGGTMTPYTIPSAGPTSAPGAQGNAPVQDTVAGAAVFVNPANHHTLYFVDGDTPPGTACNGGCLSEWPPQTPAAGAKAQGNLVIITRTDGTQQWSFNGHALYEFAGDNGPDQSNGVYGPWHMARPSSM